MKNCNIPKDHLSPREFQLLLQVFRASHCYILLMVSHSLSLVSCSSFTEVLVEVQIFHFFYNLINKRLNNLPTDKYSN